MFLIIFSLITSFVLFLFNVDYFFFIGIGILTGGLVKIGSNINITNEKLLLTHLYNLIISPLVPVTLIILAIFYEPKSETIIITNSIILFSCSLIFARILALYH